MILTAVLPGNPDATPGALVVAAFAGVVLAAVMSGLVLVRETRTRALITPAYLFFIYYAVFVLVGGLYIFWNRGEGTFFHYEGTRNWAFLLTIGLGLPVFTGGVMLANRRLRFDPKASGELTAPGPWIDAVPTGPQRFLFWFLAVVSLAATYILLFLGPTAPLLLLLRNLGNHTVAFDYKLDYARLAFISPNAGALPFQATLYQFYGNLLPLLAVLATGWATAGRRPRWLLATLLLGAVALGAASATLSKNPVENLIVLWFLGWLTFRARPVKAWQGVTIGAAAIAAFFAIVLITNRSATLPMVVAGTFRRLFQVQVNVLYSLFEWFPAHQPFLLGGGLLMDFRNLKPGPKSSLDFGTWLYSQIVSDAPGLGGVGSAPTAFFGQLYADFGVPFALLGLLAAGFFAQAVYIWYRRAPHSLVNWCVFVGVTASLPRINTSSLVSIFFQYGVIASLLFGLYFAWGERLLARLRPRSQASVAAAGQRE